MTTSLPARQERERVYWNRHYSRIQHDGWREEPFSVWRDALPGRAGAMGFLGPVAGRRILCCGVAREAIIFARAGAEVYGFDISETQIRAIQALAQQRGLGDRVKLQPMAFEEMDYPDSFFDLAYGAAILHHVDLIRGALQLQRVLKPKGKAAFIEPLATNPLVNFARRHLPYRGKHRTVDEQPLNYEDIKRFTETFAHARVQEVRLFGMLKRRVLGGGRVIQLLEQLDAVALDIAPTLGRFCSQCWIGVQR